MTLHEPTSVALANGRHATLTPGAWDDSVAEVYQQGQCLALAVTVAERFGEAGAVGYIFREDDELAHAVAIVKDAGVEWAVDSYGWTDLDSFAVNYGISIHDVYSVSAATARADADSFTLLPEQDFELAGTFTAHVAGMRA